MLFRLFFLISAIFVQASCKRVAVKSTTGFILGTDQIQKIDSEDSDAKVVDLTKAAVVLATKLDSGRRKFCSGSLIKATDDSRKYRVLTNYHCFAETSDDGIVANGFIEEACKQTTVYFGFTFDKAGSVQERQCAEGSLSGDYRGDLAVFTLREDAPEGSNHLELWDKAEVPAERRAILVHHPDVEENYKEIAQSGVKLPAAATTNEDCKTLGNFTVDEWPLDQTLPFSLKHSCDLIHGSSGSALIDYATNKILGVNWGGIDIRFKEETTKVNAATKADYVIAFLEAKQEVIQKRTESLAADAEAERQEGQRKKKKLSAKDLTANLCGVTGSGSHGNWLIFLLLLSPVAPALFFRYSS